MRAVARATAVLCAYSGAFWGAPSGTPNSLSASDRTRSPVRGTRSGDDTTRAQRRDLLVRQTQLAQHRVGVRPERGRLANYLKAGLLLPEEDETLTIRATRAALTKLEANPARIGS